jgi:hypothetical protein
VVGVVKRDRDLAADNERLSHEVRVLRERIRSFETSRWWRLHPRFLLRRASGVRETSSAVEGEAVRWASFPSDFEDADRELCQRVAAYTMTTPSRLYALARAVEYVVAHGIRGAIVECGVWRGGSMMAVALTLQRLGVTDRDLYLFDTFAGMTEPGEEDVTHSGEAARDLLAEKRRNAEIWAYASLDDVRANVLGTGYPPERIRFVEGPVEETLPREAPPGDIAILRLDTDWYASTKHELVHLYPRLVSRGVLILDDYGHWRGSRQAYDEYAAEHGLELLLNRLDPAARIAVKP